MNAMMKSVPAAAAVVAAPSILTAAPTSNSADAELIELGKQFVPLFLDWLPLHEESGRLSDELAKFRYDFGDDNHWTEERVMQEVEASERVTGYDDADEVWAAVLDKMDPIAGAIMARRPTTLEGFAIQALVTLHNCCHYDWTGDFDDLDWDIQGVRALVESVLTAHDGFSVLLRQFKEVNARENERRSAEAAQATV